MITDTYIYIATQGLGGTRIDSVATMRFRPWTASIPKVSKYVEEAGVLKLMIIGLCDNGDNMIILFGRITIIVIDT